MGLENVALWHERDISHSSAERVIIPDACHVLHYMLVKFAGLIEHLEVDHDRMLANLEGTRGLVFSQAVLLALVEDGSSRDDAYRIVQRNALASWDGGGHLLDLLKKDPAVDLTSERLRSCFSIERSLANSAIVFERLETLEI